MLLKKTLNIIIIAGLISFWSFPALSFAEDQIVPNELTFNTILVRGAAGGHVKNLQIALNELGYLSATPNGVFGPQTESAIKAFQADNSLIPDGLAGSSTYNSINAALKNIATAEIEEVLVEVTQETSEGKDEETQDENPVELTNLEQEEIEETISTCQAPKEPICEFDLSSNSLSCTELEGISKSINDSSVLKTTIDNSKGAYGVKYKLQIDDFRPMGWIFNIGDSSGNNGWGGDQGNIQSNNAEIQLNNGLLSIFRNDYGVFDAKKPHLAHNKLINTDDIISGEIQIEILNNKINYKLVNKEGVIIENETIEDKHLFALDGQNDNKGEVNYDIFASFNRTIADSTRTGSGVKNVSIYLLDNAGLPLSTNINNENCHEETKIDITQKVTELTDETVCHIDFANEDNNSCTSEYISSELFGKSLFSQNYKSGLFKISLDPSKNHHGYSLEFTFNDTDLSGWLLNLGDSATNNGWGGDKGTQDHNAELQLFYGLLSLYRSSVGVYDHNLPQVVLNEPIGLEKLKSGKLTISVVPGGVNYILEDKIGAVIDSQDITEDYLFSLSGELDKKDESNYDYYLGVNRTISGKRQGSGVESITINILTE